MSVVVLAICAAVSYLIGGLNSAIILSKLVYGEDIRTKGSKNPNIIKLSNRTLTRSGCPVFLKNF